MSCGLQPCPQCPKVRIPVPGDGPLDAEVVGIAESPGKDEDDKGRPFVGRTGKEMNQLYMPMGGLHRDSVYFTNTVKCWPRSDRDISDEIVMSCAGFHLRAELARLRNAKVVILMGAVACSLAGLDVDMHHGRPRQVEMLGFKLTVFPMFHPALGMHDYAMMNALMDDWKALGEFLRTGEFVEPVDEFPNPVYLQQVDPRDVRRTFSEVDPQESVAIDTEFDPLPVGVDPECLTYTLTPGTGYLIRARDREAVQEFNRCLGSSRTAARVPERRRRKILMHNALADLPVVEAMGVEIDARDVGDTMILAYNQATMPQALKVLAYRLCGMEMVEFNDLVTPYAVEHWLAYIEMVSQDLWPKPEPYLRMVPENYVEEMNGQKVVVGKHMVEKMYKPQGLTTKLKRLITDYKKEPGPKVFKRWTDWDDVEKAPCVAKYGDMPRKSIKMVSDMAALLNYACRDSDATKRVHAVLRKQLREFRRRWAV